MPIIKPPMVLSWWIGVATVKLNHVHCKSHLKFYMSFGDREKKIMLTTWFITSNSNVVKPNRTGKDYLSCWSWSMFQLLLAVLEKLYLNDYFEFYIYVLSRYEGLSDKFLSCPVPKLLLLAGTDRLDRFVLNTIEKRKPRNYSFYVLWIWLLSYKFSFLVSFSLINIAIISIILFF